MSPAEATSDTGVYISDELLINILKRLPVKSLLRFISVCQSWYSLIKNPHFISTHLSHQIAIAKKNGSCNQSEPRYLLYVENDLLSRQYFVHSDNELFDRTEELIFPEFPPGFEVVQAGMCNGIVCLGHNLELHAVLWNPSLRKLLRLNIPHTVGPVETRRRGIRGDGFDPSKYYTFVSYNYSLIHGIGFDSCSNDYKFVSISASRDLDIWPVVETKVLSVCVYSLNQGAWKAVNSDYVPNGDCIHFGGVNLNGVIHWLVEDSSGGPSVPVSILTFSLADETFGEIPLPEGIDYSRAASSCSDYARVMTFPAGNSSGEKIAYIHMNCNRLFVNLWIMEIYGVKESWRLVVSLGGERDGYKRIMNVRKNGEILVELEGGHLASLNPMDMSLKVVYDDPLSMAYVGCFMETLALL